MSSTIARPSPPDQRERVRALDSSRSILVQAPAGSGKTDLLTRRFLRLLGEVDSPAEIVAITFTKAAAAEMRHRILAELERAQDNLEGRESSSDGDEFSMLSLARRAVGRSRALGWNLLATPAQLRISTIDSFCRELALQQPLLTGLGSGIDVAEQPSDLYRRAARNTLQEIDRDNGALGAAVESLLAWRDNNWQDLDDLLVKMLAQRDRWMHEFVLQREPDWEALRARLEHPFANAVRDQLTEISSVLDQIPGAKDEALDLARFACEEPGKRSPHSLAECVEITSHPFADDLESIKAVYRSLADFLQTQKGEWRSERGLQVHDGFPATPRGRSGKARFYRLVTKLDTIPDLEVKLASISTLPPVRYSEDEWQIVRACFTLLRRAAAELHVVFAESGMADFIEVAQTAQSVLQSEDGLPSEAALSAAEGIHHLLVDEFQDTSRRQHKLLAGLVAAWPQREGRTLFAVGDPMQSIYFFRDADAELFPRVRDLGLELNNGESLRLDFVPLSANFRTAPQLLEWLNDSFKKIFARNDGSGISFAPATPAREHAVPHAPPFALHLDFIPQSSRGAKASPGEDAEIEAARQAQLDQIIELIRTNLPEIEAHRSRGEKFRMSILGRTKISIAAVAAALREAAIPFRAVELENLGERPEVRDVIALAHALLNPLDRVSWLGVLRAPWCGLALDDLHKLVSNDESELVARPVPDLLAERSPMVGEAARTAVTRILQALEAARQLRSTLPNASLGTWLEQIWLRLGGADCVDAAARANLDLLWNCLDKLPSGEVDLLSPALDASLEKLTALPDPATSSECGVQLMTIHKSKGLEFEIVIVPDLQARCGSTRSDLLSWLERGVAPNRDESNRADAGEITEFLIAPLQARGADRGDAKGWVDRIRREREAQEDRRILYVAATRAREQLHFFALPSYTTGRAGELILCEPKNSLLATAWPALEAEIRSRFADWSAAAQPKYSAQIPSIAASAGVIEMPVRHTPNRLRRLPPGYRPSTPDMLAASQPVSGSPAGAELYERHEGSLESRALGIAVHALMERLSRLGASNDWQAARSSLAALTPRVAADVRALGLDAVRSASIAAAALDCVRKASHDAVCQWILAPHADASSEIRWVGLIDGALRTVQVDRIFRAGPEPHTEGDNIWWIIDFKTHDWQPDANSAKLLPQLRPLFAPQLELYVTLLRKLRGPDAPIRAGIYYPGMLAFDWWEI